MSDVIIISAKEFMDRAAQPINPYLSLLLEQPGADISDMRCYISEWREQPTPRSRDAAAYMCDLARWFKNDATEDSRTHYPRTTIFQAEDNPADAISASWERKASWHSVRLIPDLYYYRARGHEDYLPDSVTPWAERQARVIWRGASTGIVGLTEALLGNLARYRLCRSALPLGDVADVKISGIVQATSDEQHALIHRRMVDDHVFGDFFPMDEMTQFKLIVDIDGNSNSWNFMAKLRLGACVLRVDSEWQQWFSPDLEPWVHYVPVAANLSDFVCKVEWCLFHDAEAQAIARRGREFALNMRYAAEMEKAARIVFAE